MISDYNMDNNIKDWYADSFPDDEEVSDIPSSLTFNDFLERLGNENAYEILNVGDSIVRERVFNAIFHMTNIDYEELWSRHNKAFESDTGYKKMMEKASKTVLK